MMFPSTDNYDYSNGLKEHKDRLEQCKAELGINTISKHFDKHYGGSIQPIELMQAQLSHEAFIGFLLGNIIKYSCRFGKKDAGQQEAAKIHRYAEWLEIASKGETIDPTK